MKELGAQAKQAAQTLAQLNADQKNTALFAIAKALRDDSNTILTANAKDLDAAIEKKLSKAMLDRLRLDDARLENMASAVEKICDIPDPVGQVLQSWQVESGLNISRVAIPIGVIGIIYESRPNVTVDAAALCLKSGNAAILRGGSECVHTNHALMASLQKGLQQSDVPINAAQMVPSQDRKMVDEMLALHDDIDVIIPRGGATLIQHIREHSSIPVFSHLQGLCHTYIHKDANLAMAQQILLNAKMRRTGICGATETCLIDREIAADYLPTLLNELIDSGCEIRGDDAVQAIDARVLPVSDKDWATEYLDAVLSIKTVENIDEAIAHINQYGTDHTEAIITDNQNAAQQFLKQVNSAIVMHNCSTQFADGGEFGMGAEIGIATGKLHARGPVGAAQLCTFKYVVKGQGQTR